MNESKILSSSFLRLSGGAPPGEDSSFKLGEILRGKVVQQVDPQHAFLNLRGQDLLVETQVFLPPGVKLQFRVEEVEPKVILKLLPSESPEEQKIYSILKRLLSGDVPLEDLSQ